MKKPKDSHRPTQLSFDFVGMTPVQICACCHWVRSCKQCCLKCAAQCSCPHTCEQGMHDTSEWLNSILRVTDGINEFFLDSQPDHIRKALTGKV